MAYDRQFRREMLARKDLNWSVSNARLYNEAFTGRATSIPQCPHCLGDDQTGATCPFNPSPIVVGWLQDNRPFLPSSTTVTPFLQGQPCAGTSRAETCRNFNDNRCRFPRCRYQHACSFCRGPHPVVACPTAIMGQVPSCLGGSAILPVAGQTNSIPIFPSAARTPSMEPGIQKWLLLDFRIS